MTPLLVRSSLRGLLRHPWQAGLAVVGVALGVMVAVAIDLANASARRAFNLSTAAVSGRATHRIVGGPDGLADDVFARLVTEAGLAAAPIVEEYVALASSPRLLHLLGVDVFSEAPLRPYLSVVPDAGERGSFDLGALLTRPGACLLLAETARELQLSSGDRFGIRVAGRPVALTLAGTLDAGDESSRRALADLVVVDIATAQEVLERPGRIDRIDLALPEGPAGEAMLTRVRRLLPAGAQILPASSRTRTSEEMTRSFRLNLTALSLLALVCGAFLIYNTITFSVVQRRPVLGALRALGVTRGEVFSLVLAEAAVVAVVGTAVGLLCGALLGRGLVQLVTRTINDLYFVVAVRDVSLPAWTLTKGIALGLGATLLAALAPAFEAAISPPRAVLARSTLELRLRRNLPRLTLLAAALLGIGALLLALRLPLGIGFTGLFLVILGCGLLTVPATVALMRLLQRPMGAAFGALGRMAAGGVVASLSRTGVAIAALVIAVSVTVGVGVMIASFRGSVERWLDRSLAADVYASVPTRGGGFVGGTVSPELADTARALPGVRAVRTLRRVEILAPIGPIRLIGLGSDIASLTRSFELMEGKASSVWPAFAAGQAIVVSEPFANRTGLAKGDSLTLPTRHGPRSFPISGVYYDYASDQGLVLISRASYLAHWNDSGLSGFSLDLEPAAKADEVIAGLRDAIAPVALSIQSNRDLKRASLAVFDRTFLITSVLRLLAGLVAFVGVLSALMALQLERARELGVLRAVGLTPGQLWRLVTAQTGLIGLAAGLFALPVGLTLSAIMIYVINRRSFGWTIRMDWSPEVLLQAVTLALGAALLAGLYPAYRMARTEPAAALREE
jgi:putative ABC transport system permease protein